MTHTLHLGDCLSILPTLPSNSIHLTFTSPPYFNAKDYKDNNPFPTYDDYLLFLDRTFKEVHRVTDEGRFCVVNSSPVLTKRKNAGTRSIRHPIPYHLFQLMDKDWEFIDEIIWVKPEGSVPNRNANFYQIRKPLTYKPNVVTETLLVFRKRCDFLINKSLKGYSQDITTQSLIDDGYERSNVWNIKPETKGLHPAPFPVELADKVVSYYSFVGDTILDPFMGSGTTGTSCKKLNRTFIGIEQSPDYLQIAEMRLKQQ